MLLRYLSLAVLLSLSSLSAHSETSSDHRYSPLFSDEAKDSEDHSLARIKNDLSLLLSIPMGKRNFENFLLPLICMRSELVSILDASQQKSELIESVIQEVDPNDCFSTAIADLLAKYTAESLNPYQKHLLSKIQPQSESRLGIFFFDEPSSCAREEQHAKGPLSILNCSIQSYAPTILEETINGITETAPDVVCIQNIANEEVRYNLYERLRESYGCFCIEDELEGRLNGYTLIASKYYLDSYQDSFLDKSGVFFDLNIVENDKEIGRMLLARPNRAKSFEKLDESIEQAAESIVERLLSSSIPVLFCGNFSYKTAPSDSFGSFLDSFFQNDETDDEVCTLLLRTHELMPKSIISIPLSRTQRGLKFSCFAGSLGACLKRGCQEQTVLACDCQADVSGSADRDGGFRGDVGVGVSGDGWSVGVHGGVRRDHHGHVSGGARVDVHAEW
jgi:hypothetical protein